MKAIPSLTQALNMYRLIVATFGRPHFNNKRKTGRVLKWYRLVPTKAKRDFKRLVAAGLDKSFVSLDTHSDSPRYGRSDYACLNLTVPIEFVPSAVDAPTPPVKPKTVRTKTSPTPPPDRSVEMDARRFRCLITALADNEVWAYTATDNACFKGAESLIKAIDKRLSKKSK